MYLKNSTAGLASVVDVKNCVEFEFECCVVEVNLRDISLMVVTVYRSQQGDFSAFLEKLADTLHVCSKKKVQDSALR